MKRLIFLIFVPLLVLLTVHAQKISWNKSYQDYIDQYREVAIQQMLMHGIPASITLAQGVLESGAGRSELARKAKNHFGIKCN
jgi:flagellum-specific peptidoglycan hydrolase FlgJ